MRRYVLAVCVFALVAGACSSSSHKSSSASTTAPASASSAVQVVSSRPDMVTGGEALLSIAGSGTPTISANGAALKVTPVRKWWLVSGIPNGATKLAVKRGDTSADVAVSNSPITGPVFSGPHMPLLACSTED